MIYLRNTEKIKHRVKNLLTLTLIILAIYCAIRYSEECSNGITSGLVFCVSVLVPSLFIFMILSSYISNIKAINYINKLLKKPTEKFFNLPKESAGVIIMSLLGGYPVGAKSCASLYESGSINIEQAKKLSMIAVCSGPGFILNYIGRALMHNNKAGTILLCSQYISFFVVAVIVGKLIKVKDETVEIKSHTKKFGIIDAVSSGCTATINMCAIVTAFSAVISVSDSIFSFSSPLSNAVCSTLEVTTACNRLINTQPLYVISFITGFGGLSVHCQIFSILKDIKINKPLFFFLRILQGIISAITTYILLILFPVTEEVFSTVTSTTPTVNSTVWGALALILTAVCFLNSIKLKRR